MINKQINITEMAGDALMDGIQNIVDKALQKFKDAQPERLLSPAETCKLFQPPISKVTLASWTAQGKLQDHRIGGRIYYRQSQVLESLTKLKRYKN
jgi:hypothetical protein